MLCKQAWPDLLACLPTGYMCSPCRWYGLQSFGTFWTEGTGVSELRSSMIYTQRAGAQGMGACLTVRRAASIAGLETSVFDFWPWGLCYGDKEPECGFAPRNTTLAPLKQCSMPSSESLTYQNHTWRAAMESWVGRRWEHLLIPCPDPSLCAFEGDTEKTDSAVLCAWGWGSAGLESPDQAGMAVVGLRSGTCEHAYACMVGQGRHESDCCMQSERLARQIKRSGWTIFGLRAPCRQLCPHNYGLAECLRPPLPQSNGSSTGTSTSAEPVRPQCASAWAGASAARCPAAAQSPSQQPWLPPRLAGLCALC